MSDYFSETRNNDPENLKLLDEELAESLTIEADNSQKRTVVISSDQLSLPGWSIPLSLALSAMLLLVTMVGASAYSIQVNTVVPALILVQRLAAAVIFTDMVSIGGAQVDVRPLFGFAPPYRRYSLILNISTLALGVAGLMGAVTSLMRYFGGEMDRKVCWMKKTVVDGTITFEYGRDCWDDQSVLIQGVLATALSIVLLAGLAPLLRRYLRCFTNRYL
ncbi:hypothetical protein AAF712_003245 [Marasmius tenuissimus]|uniref:CASP-like protein n=1 Tax=Marasmius tenuissimus TaxID=585030 RepID=A0ABR3A6I3_9AGAR